MNYPFPEWAGIGKFVYDEDEEQWMVVEQRTFFDETYDRERGALLLKSTTYANLYQLSPLTEFGEDPGVQGIEA